MSGFLTKIHIYIYIYIYFHKRDFSEWQNVRNNDILSGFVVFILRLWERPLIVLVDMFFFLLIIPKETRRWVVQLAVHFFLEPILRCGVCFGMCEQVEAKEQKADLAQLELLAKKTFSSKSAVVRLSDTATTQKERCR